MPFLLLAALQLLPGTSLAAWEDQWEKIAPTELPALVPDGDIPSFLRAIRRQKENCREFRAKRFRHCGGEGSGPELVCDEALLRALEKMAGGKNASWGRIYAEARKRFDWFRYRSPPEKVLFTGYNSPSFEGSLTKTERFRHPILGRPDDLVVAKDEKGASLTRRRLPDGSFAPYYTRREIEVEQRLAGRGLEIAWLESPADVLRLQIEGSGILLVKDAKGGAKQHGINYAGKNGQPYVSVFKTLKESGVDKKYLSFPGLQAYFRDHPAEAREALNKSPSYVFFSLATEPPCGTARVHITGDHSLATDPTHLPLGLMAFVEAERPVEGTAPDAAQVPMKPFTRFAIAQDTGGAIKGAHVDVYWGSSEYAMLASNSMKSRGALFLPRSRKRSGPHPGK